MWPCVNPMRRLFPSVITFESGIVLDDEEEDVLVDVLAEDEMLVLRSRSKSPRTRWRSGARARRYS